MLLTKVIEIPERDRGASRHARAWKAGDERYGFLLHECPARE
jgi:hypothetical protein